MAEGEYPPTNIHCLIIATYTINIGVAPYHAFKPLKALFLTATQGAPPLKKANKWGNEFKQFLSKCFEQDASARPSASELLKVNYYIDRSNV
jgi:serine/threonine protein kinase